MHAATVADEFAGFIEATAHEYRLFGRHAQPLGAFRHLRSAQAALRPAGRTTPHPDPRAGAAGAVNGTASGGPRTRRKDDMASGTVKWFNSDKGFGFIAPADGSADVFAHFSAIVGNGRRDLYEGQQVEFDTERGQKGLQATNIRGL